MIIILQLHHDTYGLVASYKQVYGTSWSRSKCLLCSKCFKMSILCMQHSYRNWPETEGKLFETRVTYE